MPPSALTLCFIVLLCVVCAERTLVSGLCSCVGLRSLWPRPHQKAVRLHLNPFHQQKRRAQQQVSSFNLVSTTCHGNQRPIRWNVPPAALDQLLA
jgi:hypothetical protein